MMHAQEQRLYRTRVWALLPSPFTAIAMTRTITAGVFTLSLMLLTACASVSNNLEADRQLQIQSRYQQARANYRQQMAPLADYFVKTCGPLPDRDYLACINSKRNEIAALSIYPEQPATASRRLALENQLLTGQIDRKQFRSQLEAQKTDDETAQLNRDIANGAYSGRY